MQNINIYNTSIIFSVAEQALSEISCLNKFARKETVELIFKDDWCRIVAKSSRKIRVPKKAIASSEGLVKWIEERIRKAWS